MLINLLLSLSVVLKNLILSIVKFLFFNPSTSNISPLENIVVLDLEGVTTLSDYFILATASSSPQMKAGSDAVYKELKEDGILPYAENDNDPEALWYLTDYGFLVIHIFTEEGREYYDLDKLWHEAKKIELNY